MSIDTSAVNIVTPALGPSFGIAAGRDVDVDVALLEEVLRRCRSARRSCGRTTARPARDSFMTSPSCPVSCSLPVPYMRVASMKRISPPTLVHASPVATPASSVRSATSLVNFCGPRNSRTCSSSSILRGVVSPFGDLHGHAANDAGDLALERANAGFARVVSMTRSTAVSVMSSCSLVMPCSSSCFGIRCRRAIASFSRRV